MSAVMHTFARTPEQLAQWADEILVQAKRLGASDARVNFFESAGLNVGWRQGRLLSRTRRGQSYLSVTTYLGERKGSAGTSDFSLQGITEIVRAALGIARYTDPDPWTVLPEGGAPAAGDYDALSLYHPWRLDESDACARLSAAESTALDTRPSVQSESDGLWLTAYEEQIWLATSRGVSKGYRHTRHGQSAKVLSRHDGQQEVGFASDERRDATQLKTLDALMVEARHEAVSSIGGRPLSTRRCPVLFDARAAISLLGHLAQACSGDAVWQQNSFLAGRIGESVLPDSLSLLELPDLPGAVATRPFDGDGLCGTRRTFIEDGRLRGYFLSLSSARRSKMTPTGSGPYSLHWVNRQPTKDASLNDLCRVLGTGLLVTSLSGDGVNLLSGDYSRSAKGFWVENGTVAQPVNGITLAGNLRQMFAGILAVGRDSQQWGPFRTGPVLIDEMQIGGGR